MRSVGVAVKMESTPRVKVVLFSDDDDGGATVETAFDLTTVERGVADQIHDLASQLGARMTGIHGDVVVVARASFGPGSQKPARQTRLLIEGALVHAARRAGTTALLRDGKEIGAACGSDKATVYGQARALDKSREEACAAALSGLASVPRPEGVRPRRVSVEAPPNSL